MTMKITRLLPVITLSIVLMTLTSYRASSQNNLPYLGQTPPGLTAKRFPPDSMLAAGNRWWHGSPAFSPDGLEMFWTEYIHYTPTVENAVLFTTKVSNNNWLPVEHPPFADTAYFENNPVMSVTGDTLYFLSLRPQGAFFRVTRIPGGWSQPTALNVPIPTGYYLGLQLAVTRHGDLYFELTPINENQSDLFVSRLVNGVYQTAEKLDDAINSEFTEWGPFVDPNGEYLIFSSNRPGMIGQQYDLYIGFKDGNGSWMPAMNMGYEVNSTGAYFPAVTLDRQYLFFNTARPGDWGYNAYWISAAIIDSLRLCVGVNSGKAARNRSGRSYNQPNPFSETTQITFELNSPTTIVLEVFAATGISVYKAALNGWFEKGKNGITFDASTLDPGVYYYRISPEKGEPLLGAMLVVQ